MEKKLLAVFAAVCVSSIQAGPTVYVQKNKASTSSVAPKQTKYEKAITQLSHIIEETTEFVFLKLQQLEKLNLPISTSDHDALVNALSSLEKGKLGLPRIQNKSMLDIYNKVKNANDQIKKLQGLEPGEAEEQARYLITHVIGEVSKHYVKSKASGYFK